MKTYRCTFPSLYPAPTCPGHVDPSARQGHYADAPTPALAALDVAQRGVADGRVESGLVRVDVQEEGSLPWEKTPAVRFVVNV